MKKSPYRVFASSVLQMHVSYNTNTVELKPLKNSGNLPPTLPLFASFSRTHLPLAQICHTSCFSEPLPLLILLFYLRLINSKYRTTWECTNSGLYSTEKTSSEYWSASQRLVRWEPGWVGFWGFSTELFLSQSQTTGWTFLTAEVYRFRKGKETAKRSFLSCFVLHWGSKLPWRHINHHY